MAMAVWPSCNWLESPKLGTGKPVVLVLFTGRPLAIKEENEKVPAILNVWFGGSEAGFAIADVLFGNVNPSGKLTTTFQIYPNIGTLLPAMGYGEQQLRDLEETINKTDCDSVIIATPIDLNRIIKIKKPNTRVYYDLQEIGDPNLEQILDEFLKKHKL